MGRFGLVSFVLVVLIGLVVIRFVWVNSIWLVWFALLALVDNFGF